MKNRHFRVFIMIRISQTFVFRKIMSTTTRYRLDFRWLRRKLRLPFYSFWSSVVLGKPVEETELKVPTWNPSILEKSTSCESLKWGVEKGIWPTHTQQKISKLRLFSIFFSIKIPRCPFIAKHRKKSQNTGGWDCVCVCVGGGGGGVCVGVWVWNQYDSGKQYSGKWRVRLKHVELKV